MKTKTLIIFLFSFSLVGFCCDNCNVYFNLTPDDGRHTIGMYYRMRGMQGIYNGFGQQLLTKHAAHGNDPAFWGNEIKETFRTYELRGDFQLGNRWKTYVILPLVQNSQYINNVERYTVSGISDPILLQGFQVFDPTRVPNRENIIQRLELGAGIKFPLGKIHERIGNDEPNLDLQAGTGSWDLLGFMKYMLRINKTGMLINSNYKWNSANKDGYRYGNVINASLNWFYQTEVNTFTFIPLVGANIEHAAYDFTTEEHFDTGGTAIFVGGGLQVFWKGIRFFTEFQKAVSNNLNGYTQLINKYKWNIGLSYYF